MNNLTVEQRILVVVGVAFQLGFTAYIFPEIANSPRQPGDLERSQILIFLTAFVRALPTTIGLGVAYFVARWIILWILDGRAKNSN